MAIDGPDRCTVTRWFKRVCADDFPKEIQNEPHEIGIFFNDAFDETVANALEQVEGSDKYSFMGMKYEPAEKLLSPRVMLEKFFDATNRCRSIRNCWNAQIYEDWVVLYDVYDSDMEKPLKAWRRYNPNWDEEGF